MMGIDNFLIHKCTITRMEKSAETIGRYNETIMADNPITTQQICRLVEESERIAGEAGVESLIVTTYTLLLPANADVQERDEISNILIDPPTGEVLEGPFLVRSLIRRAGHGKHHLKAELILPQ